MWIVKNEADIFSGMRLTTVTICLFFPSCLLAQTTQTPAPKEPPPIIWSSGAPNCKLVYMNGTPVERFDNGSITVDAMPPLQRDKRLFSVLVGVRNSGNGDIDVDPTAFAAQSNDGTLVDSVDMDPVLNKEEHHAMKRERMAAAFSGFGAGMSRQNGTVYNSNGTTSQVTMSDPEAVRRAAGDAADARSDINNHFAKDRSRLLRHNTLANQGFALGFVYFQLPKGTEKHATLTRVAVQLGNQTYIFSGWPTK
jgi:hypothetical protein